MPDPPKYESAYLRALYQARQDMQGENGLPSRALRALREEYRQMLFRVAAEGRKGTVTLERAEELSASIRRHITDLSERLGLLVGDGARQAAEIAVSGHREGLAAAEAAAGMSTGQSFAEVPRRAVEGLMRRRGLGVAETFQTLVARRAQNAAQDLDRVITSAVGRGVSGRRLSQEIAVTLAQGDEDMLRVLENTGARGGLTDAARAAGVELDLAQLAEAKKLLSDAQRIAVTEINNTYFEADREAAATSPVVDLLRWQLSGRHQGLRSSPDVCDLYATQDLHGYGAGLYHPETLPAHPHPYCACVTQKVLRPPEEWDDPKRPVPEPTEMSEAEVRAKLEEIAEGRPGARSITDKYVQAQAKAANRHVALAHKARAARVPRRYRVKGMTPGSSLSPEVEETLREYSPEAYSQWIEVASNAAREGRLPYDADDIEQDVRDHAAELDVAGEGREAFVSAVQDVIAGAGEFFATYHAGSQVQLLFVRDDLFAVVDRNMRIRSAYRNERAEAISRIKASRLRLEV